MWDADEEGLRELLQDENAVERTMARRARLTELAGRSPWGEEDVFWASSIGASPIFLPVYLRIAAD